MPVLKSVEARNQVRSTFLRTPEGGGGKTDVFGALTAALDGLNEQLTEVRQRDEDVASIRAMSELGADFTRQFLERREAAEPGAPNFTNTLVSDFREAAKDQLANTPARLRPRVEAFIGSMGQELMQKGLAFEFEARGAKRLEDAQGIVDATANRLNGPGVTLDDLASAIATTEDAIETVGVQPTLLAETKRSATQTLITSYVQGLEDRNPSQVIELLDSGQFDERLDPKVKTALRDGAEVEVRRRQVQARAMASLQTAELVDEARAATTVLLAGRQPTTDVDALKEDLRAVGTRSAQRAALALEEAVALGGSLRDFTLSPLSDQAQAVTDLRTAETISEQELTLLSAYEKAHTAIGKALKEDAVSLGVEVGILDEAVPLDLTNPDSLSARAEQAGLVGQAYGVPVSPLSQAEVAGLETLLDRSNPGAAAALLTNLRLGFGEEGTLAIADQFGTSRPHLAFALQRASKGDSGVAADIIEGARLARENKDLRPEETAVASAANRAFGSFFDTASDLRAPVVAAATALYARRIVRDFNGVHNDDALEDAFRTIGGARVDPDGEVEGGPFRYRSRWTLPLEIGGDEDDFRDALGALEDRDLVNYGNGTPIDLQGRPISAEDLQSDANAVAISFGRYAFEFDGLGTVAAADGERGVYVLDLKSFWDDLNSGLRAQERNLGHVISPAAAGGLRMADEPRAPTNAEAPTLRQAAPPVDAE